MIRVALASAITAVALAPGAVQLAEITPTKPS
jgi:hypothetical protein